MIKKNSKNKKTPVIKNTNNNFQNKLLNLKFGFDDFMDDFFKIPNTFDYDFFSKEDFTIPSMNLSETKDGYKVSVELPGINKENIDVSLRDNVLSIDAEKSEKDVDKGENFYRQECSYGSYHRSIRMPNNIKSDSMEAKYKNGVLVISVKKDETLSSSSKKITIK